VRELLVLWQHPTTREIIPVGRFGFDGAVFTFRYTRGASEIPDFRPLLGFPDLNHEYTSDRMPLIFGQRIMEPDRPDYEDYIRGLGLDPTEATPWEQIVESGGARVGDTLQFMQVPEVKGGRARARFLANGVRHIPGHSRIVNGQTVTVSVEQHEAALGRLVPGDRLLVEPEAGNEWDACAALVTTDGVPLGYVPRVLSSSIRELLELAPQLVVRVVRVGAPGTAPHLRLVLDLDEAVPQGFQFDREGRWASIATA
jgi:hypothetical protein